MEEMKKETGASGDEGSDAMNEEPSDFTQLLEAAQAALDAAEARLRRRQRRTSREGGVRVRCFDWLSRH